MTTITPDSRQPVFRTLFPDWAPPRPVAFFMLENLLEARAGSIFPTNIAGFDKDVNVYLGQLLAHSLSGAMDPRVTFGSGCVLHPPGKTLSRRDRTDYYRVNAEHRLLWLGLFNRGEDLRRRGTLFGLDAGETRRRDLAAGQACFEVAANLLDGRGPGNAALVAIWRKLARHFEEYVTVLTVMATRRFDLGARLSQTDLDLLWESGAPAPAPEPSMDDFLDLLLDMQKAPDPAGLAALKHMAGRLGVDPVYLERAAG